LEKWTFREESRPEDDVAVIATTLPLEKSSPPRIEFMDSLRGLAILGVLLVHAGQATPGLSSALTKLTTAGQYGVQLFFVASAFTLFLSQDSRRNEAHPIRNFFIRRFFRIAPMFYVGIGFYLAWFRWSPWAIERRAFTAGHIATALTFTNGLHPAYINDLPPGGWSVAIEMMFYLCLPLLHRVVRSLRDAVALAFGLFLLALAAHAVLMSGPVVRTAMAHVPGVRDVNDWQNGFVYLWLVNQLPVFGLGIVAYYIHRKIAGRDRTWGNLLLAIAAFMMLAMVTGGYPLLPAHVMYGIAFVILATACSFYSSPVVVNRATAIIGTLSFSMYLTHFAVRDVLDHFLREASMARHPPVYLTVFFSLLLIGTIAVSAVTYQLIEVPGMNLGRKIIKRLSAPREPAAMPPAATAPT
jgi:peptidoglycan/LPS O-acetylase OafA/YrhL